MLQLSVAYSGFQKGGGAYRGQKIFLCPKWPFLENFSTMCAKNNDFGEDFSIFVPKMTNFRAFLGRFCLLYVSKKLWSDLRGGGHRTPQYATGNYTNP